MEIKYSVIIPIYNSEKTIERCLDSLLKNRPDNAELVLINDGSKDKSDAICRDYQGRYTNIVYCYKENEGVSATRNKGIEIATGEYILFVDSDDYVAENYFQQLEKMTDGSKYDLIVFSLDKINGENVQHFPIPNYKSSQRAEVMETVGKLIENKRINEPVTKIYKKEIIDENNIHFTVGASVAEDRAFNITYAMYISSIKLIDTVIYYYCIEGNESLTRGEQKNLKKDFELTDMHIEEELKKCNLGDEEKIRIKRALDFCKYREVFSNAKRMKKANIPLFKRVRLTREECKQINKEKLLYSTGVFSYMIVIPIKLRMALLINIVGNWLAR